MAVVWLLALCAVPTGLLLGLPWTASAPMLAAAVASSVLFWLLMGRWAAVRATRDVDARWRHVAVELLPTAVAVWAGQLAGMGAAAFLLIR
jgi:hypothetical protein